MNNVSNIASLEAARLQVVDTVLADAFQRDAKMVMVIGLDAEDVFFFDSSCPDGAQAVYWLEMAKHKILQEGGA